MNIVLKSSPYRVTKINVKTRANMFKNVKVGDTLVFSTELEYTSGASGGGNYATYIFVSNLTRGEYTYKSQSELISILRRVFELEEVKQ